MIETDVLETLNSIIHNSSAVVATFSRFAECNVVSKIHNPKFEFIEGTVVISNQSDDNDENEVQFYEENLIFNKYNSNDNRLVFNMKSNFLSSLVIEGISKANHSK